MVNNILEAGSCGKHENYDAAEDVNKVYLLFLIFIAELIPKPF
jgi:hypothetical protein